MGRCNVTARQWIRSAARSNHRAVRALRRDVKIIACELTSAHPLKTAFAAGVPTETAHEPGFVSGVVGALAYAKQANLLPNVSSKEYLQNQVHLDAQNLAQWLLAILIVVGIISGLVSRTGRRSS